MPNPVLFGQVIEFKIGCYGSGQAGINVIHMKCISTALSPVSEDFMADSLDEALAPLYKTILHNTASYYGVSAQKVFPLPRTVLTVESDNSGVGTGGATPLPGQVSGIITKLTNLTGRANRGRMYLPFPPTAFNDTTANKPTAAYVDQLSLIGTLLFNPITFGTGDDATTMQPVIYNTTTGATVNITGFRSNQKWATQRRRGNYGQPNPFPPF